MKKIRIAALSLVLMGATSSAWAGTIATCSKPKGHAYFVSNNLVGKKDSGWDEDKISDGVFSLQSTPSGYDISFIDIRKQITSSIADGAKIILLSRAANDAIFLVHYADTGTSEIYKFFKDTEGKSRFSVSAVRSNAAPITKMSLMVGECESIDFQSIK